MEAYEKGLIHDDETGGLALVFGDQKVIHEMIHQIARREALGDLLSQGTHIASQTIGQGSEHFALYIGGQEVN